MRIYKNFIWAVVGILLAVGSYTWAETISYFGKGAADQLGVGLITLLAGEDQTNDVIRIEQQFAYCAAVTADAQCGSPATFLHTVTCNSDAAATAGTLAIRDSTTAGGGTVIQLLTFGTTYIAPVTLTFDVALTNGLYLDFTTTADVSCSASYR